MRLEREAIFVIVVEFVSPLDLHPATDVPDLTDVVRLHNVDRVASLTIISVDGTRTDCDTKDVQRLSEVYNAVFALAEDSGEDFTTTRRSGRVFTLLRKSRHGFRLRFHEEDVDLPVA